MTTTSPRSRKSAFVPWLAALVIGATAHAGWLIHELRDDHRSPAPTNVPEARVHVEIEHLRSERALAQAERIEQRQRARAERRARAVERARTYASEAASEAELAQPLACRRLAPEPRPLESEFAAWIEKTGRYEYIVDRRLLEQVEVADPTPAPGDRLASMLGVEQGQIELRNIRRSTPLWHLGLRSGDRLLSLAQRSETGSGDTVHVSVERRGQPVVLTYRVL